jgi:hypothetical protein
MRNFCFRQISQFVIATNGVRFGQVSARRFWKSFFKPEELLGRSVERVHLKLDVRWTALKHLFQGLLRNRISK